MPAGLLAGAFAFEHLGGLPPCEMCWWQRWAHIAAFVLAALAFALARTLPDRGRSLVWLAAGAILASAGLGAWHAGIEAGWFEGVTTCTASPGLSGKALLDSILNAPMVRCDSVPWSLAGISMAGWNAILSGAGALVILWLSLKRESVRL